MLEQADVNLFDALPQQSAFRALMQAFSYPGSVCAMAEPALAHVLAVLVDGAVTLADPDSLLDAPLRALLEAQAAPPEQAQFIVADAARCAAWVPLRGSLDSPEHGATIVLRVRQLGQGDAMRLSGPGIDGSATLAVQGLAAGWLRQREAWNAGFPCGVDLILVDAHSVAALPRTTRVLTSEGDR